MSKYCEERSIIKQLKLLLQHFPDNSDNHWAIYLPLHFQTTLGKLGAPFYFSDEIEEAFIAPSPYFYLQHPETIVSFN